MTDVLNGRKTANAIVFTISGGVIAYENQDAAVVPRDKVWARADGKATFIVRNHEDDPYEVRIPFDEFQPRNGAPPHPINEKATKADRVTVPGHEERPLDYVIKPAAHFRFSSSAQAFLYKYNVHYKNLVTDKLRDDDPDLEVSP